MSIHQLSPPDAKIALFRALFRGREDVYPRRFESRKTGKSGYQPACALYILETLPRTAGRFRLNAELPIPFDNRGCMEVDLLDAESRVAIELDGSQHLGDAAAYRRDRHKDLLLQENGYFVLRFLARDVGSRLDEVLDAIQRALTHRRGEGAPTV